MGRYYTGTEADFVDDAMFKLPYELMGKALMAKQKSLDTARAGANKVLEDVVVTPYHIDAERANKIKSGYVQEVTDLVDKINADKVNASKYDENIAALQRKITLDTTSGDVYNINEKNKEMLKKREELAKQFKEKPDQFGWTSLEEGYNYLDKLYAEQGGYKKEDGTYNMTPSLELAGRDNMN